MEGSMTNVTPLPVRRRSRLTTPGIARRESEKQPDLVTERGAYSGKLAEKDPDCGGTGHRTCPAPNTVKSGLSGTERNPPEPNVDGASEGERSSTHDNVCVLESDTRSLPQQHPLTYGAWRNMKSRAHRNSHRVDPSWLGVDGFAAFFKDMGERPNAAFTLDRMDTRRGEYGPNLCRWASKRTQTENRQNTIHLTDASGACRPLGEWARLMDVSPDTMLKRKGRGWSDDEVVHGRREVTGSASPAWPPGEERDTATWEVWYAKRDRRSESRLDFVARTSRDILDWTNRKLGDPREWPPAELPEWEEDCLPPEYRKPDESCQRLLRMRRMAVEGLTWVKPLIHAREVRLERVRQVRLDAGQGRRKPRQEHRMVYDDPDGLAPDELR